MLCSKCGDDMPSESFSAGSKLSGKGSQCKGCTAETSASYRASLRASPAAVHMRSVFGKRPHWTQDRVDESLSFWNLSGHLDSSTGSNRSIVIDDLVVGEVIFSGGTIRARHLVSGIRPAVLTTYEPVNEIASLWQGICVPVSLEVKPTGQMGRPVQMLTMRNSDGRIAIGQLGTWRRRDPFLNDGNPPYNGLSLNELRSGPPSQVYVVRLCDYDTDLMAVKVGKGRVGTALSDHRGCSIDPTPMPTGWHARLAEARAHAILMPYHYPLARGTLPHGGDSEVFLVPDIGIVTDAVRIACSEVSEWNVERCEQAHEEALAEVVAASLSLRRGWYVA